MAKRQEPQTQTTTAIYTCPFCFSSVDLKDIHYQCTNPACTKMFLRELDEKGGRKYKSKNIEEEIDIENSIFLGKDPAGPSPVTTKYHIMRHSSGTCDICKKPVYKRLCPSCHNPIPQGAEEEGSNVFVLLGPKGVGKSHYIAVLINQLRNSFSPEFGATMSPATDRTTLKYRDMYYKRLYEEGRKLAPTQSFEESRESREPMIYYLRFLEGDSPRVYTLAFFDTAGEDLDSTGKMMGLNLNSFISRASGIVFLVDPLQIPYINTRIRMDNKPPAGGNVANMLSDITNIIRTNNALKMKDQIQIPLAVVLTKADVLMKAPENDEESSILFGMNSSLYIEREKGKYDRTNFEQISAEIEEYMRRAVSKGFVQTVKEFKEHSYFAVSALGSNPTGSVLSRGISPMRVEDPFIWLLNCESLEERRR
ncbi:MAG: ATP/GTP-binding protein [Methanomassiliicoccaceae archaeon]|nr:ATP/GTP-binding protein [Methanomassiliicoccaceae archaeon]